MSSTESLILPAESETEREREHEGTHVPMKARADH